MEAITNDKFDEIFEAIDKDCSGTISQDEMIEFLGSYIL